MELSRAIYGVIGIHSGSLCPPCHKVIQGPPCRDFGGNASFHRNSDSYMYDMKSSLDVFGNTSFLSEVLDHQHTKANVISERKR